MFRFGLRDARRLQGWVWAILAGMVVILALSKIALELAQGTRIATAALSTGQANTLSAVVPDDGEVSVWLHYDLQPDDDAPWAIGGSLEVSVDGTVVRTEPVDVVAGDGPRGGTPAADGTATISGRGPYRGYTRLRLGELGAGGVVEVATTLTVTPRTTAHVLEVQIKQ